MASCAAMLAFSSCEKSLVKEEQGEAKEMKIDIKVADLGCALAEGRSLKASGGQFTVVYEGYNDLSVYTYNWYNDGEWFYPKKLYDDVSNVNYHCVPLTLYKLEVPYSFSSNTLTASIDSWKFKTMFKILVKNDNGEMYGNADEYIIQAQKDSPTNKYADSLGAFVITPQNFFPNIGSGSSNYIGKTGGVQEPDCIAFYFGTFSFDTIDKVTFTLQKGSTIKSYTMTGKFRATSDDKCINIAMNYSSFTE